MPPSIEAPSVGGRSPARQAMKGDAGRRSGFRRQLIAAALLTAFTILGGVLYQQAEGEHLRAAVLRELDTSAELKARQIADWRRERLGDARLLMTTPAIGGTVAKMLAEPESTAGRAILAGFLESIREACNYESVLLLDRDLQARLVVPPNAEPPGEPLRAAARSALARRQPVMTDLHRTRPGDPVHQEVLAPIFASSFRARDAAAPAEAAEPIALIALRLNSNKFLFPLIQAQPTPSATAENLLIKREGDEIVYLNEMRFRAGKALESRRRFDDPTLPFSLDPSRNSAVREGRDYRGVAVLTAARPVPDSDWLLVAKVDRAEAYAGIRTKAWSTAVISSLALVAVLLGFAVRDRARRGRLLERTLRAEREQKLLAERLAMVSRHANDIILLLAEDLRIVDANERALTAYGYSIEELRSMKVAELRPPPTRATLARDVELIRATGHGLFETTHQRKDGSLFPVEVSSRAVNIGGQAHLLSVIRDITERRKAEANQRTILEASEDAILLVTVEARILLANAAFADRLKLSPEALVGRSLYDLLPSEIMVSRRAKLEEAVRSGRNLHFSDTRDGRYFEHAVHPLRDEQGKVDRVALYVRDVTERRQAEQAERLQHEFALRLAAVTDLPSGLKLCLETALAASRLEAGGIYLVNEGSGGLELVVHQGLSPRFAESVKYFEPASPQLRRITAGESIYRCVGEASPPLSKDEQLEGLHALAVIPLRVDGRVVGCLNIASRSLDAIPDSTRLALETIAVEAAHAVQRIKAVEALSRSLQTQSLALRIGKIGYAETDLLTGHSHWSREVADIWGLPDLGAKDLWSYCWEHVHPDDVARVRAAVQGVFELAQTAEVECRILRPDGSVRHLRWMGQSVANADGKIARVISVNLDITEQKQAAVALQESEERLRLLIQHAPISLAMFDRHMRYIEASRRWLSDYGLGERDLRGLSHYDVFPELGAEAKAVHQRALAGEVLRADEDRFVRADGNEQWLRWEVHPWRDAAGQVGGIVIFSEDITERKRRELLRAMSHEVLLLLGDPVDLADSARRIVLLIKMTTGVDAVGLRLQNGEDFPYFFQQGLPADLVQAEDSLLGRTARGEVCRDIQGRPCLECTCGLVLSGKTNTANPLFTPGGSAWSNDTRAFLESPREQDPRLNPRDRCTRQGFASIALIPLRAKGRIVGLLQLNDRRRGRFSREAIEALEDVSRNIGEAIVRKQAESDLRENEARLRHALYAAMAGIWEWDLATNRNFWTEELWSLYGLDRSTRSASYESWVESILPDDRAAVKLAVETAAGRASDLQIEWRVNLPAGQERWLLSKGRPQKDAAGKVTHYRGIVVDITARKRTEAALEDTSRRLHEAQQIAQLGSFEYIAATQATIWSEEEYRIYGLDPAGPSPAYDVMLARHIHPDDAALLHDTFSAAMRSGSVYELEHRIVRPDGGVRWVYDRAHPFYDENGALLRFVGATLDITERKQAQAALQESEARYRGLIETSFDWVWEVDAQGRYTFASSRAQELLGYAPTEILGRTPFDLMPPAEAERVRPLFAEIAARQQPIVALENTCRHRDGRLVILETSGVPIFAPDGTWRGYRGMDRDITERRAAEAALRLRGAALEAAANAIVIADSDGRIEWINPAFTALTGWTLAEALGKSPGSLLKSGEHGGDFYRRMWQAITAGQVWRGELVNRRKDGALYTEEMTITPLSGADGRIIHFVAIKHDITERRAIEARFRLSQRVEAIGTLAGGIAHDLNNILAPILLVSGVLAGKLREESDREMLAMLQSGARRGADIIRQLLTFSRGLEGTRITVELRHILKEMILIMRETFPREIDLRQQVSAGLWPVVADPTQLHQVMLNLCVNARDAMPEGGHLTIAAANLSLAAGDPVLPPGAKPGPHIRIEVRDSGEGIPDEIKHRIFDPFFTTKPTGKGTGLGLSTVLGIVQSHGGFVMFDSERGRGSTFKVFLPAVPGEAAPAAAPAVGSRSPFGQGQLILLVDDERTIREATRVVLEGAGFNVLVAINGKDALAEYLQHRDEISLVLTDLMMPVMNGAALIKELRELDPRLPIIATTGLNDADNEHDLASLGVPDLLPKPSDSSVMLEFVQRCLRRG